MSRIEEIKARAEAATPGPWSAADERELWREEDPSIEPSWCVSQMRPGFEAMSPTEGYLGDVFTTAGFFESTEADARFVAAAREDVPWLVDQVERLERWKVEALEVMSGLRELGKALGLGLGVQITGPAALAEVERLTAERDALAAQVARVEALAGQWDGDDSCDNRTCVPHRSADALRAALAGSEADMSDVDVCNGDADCTSALHVHGCFSDLAGPCTDPDEHQTTDQEADRG